MDRYWSILSQCIPKFLPSSLDLFFSPLPPMKKGMPPWPQILAQFEMTELWLEGFCSFASLQSRLLV